MIVRRSFPGAHDLRILLVLEACGGGAGRHVVDLARGLLRRGHDVSLLYSPCRADAWFLDEIQSLAGLETHALSIGRSVSTVDIATARAVRRMIDRHGPYDVLHGHSSKAGALLRLSQLGRRAPVVYTPHAPITMDPDLSLPASLAYRVAEQLLAPLCRCIICVSPAERDHLLELGLPGKKLRVVCNGIDSIPAEDRQRIRESLNIDADTVCLGFIGRICHQKAVDRLLRVFASIREKADNMHLVIVGDGPDLEEMTALAAGLDIASRVTFAGPVKGVDMLSAFDIFLLPSRYEAMPYVLLEAAASRLPIVMTNVGGADLVVRDNENGFVIRDDNIDTFGEKLLRLASRPELRREMADRSGEIAAHYSLDNMVDETLGVYDEMRRINSYSRPAAPRQPSAE